ncbi:MAG: hypothetical protein Unbinned1502contig1001_16 [Prokaryotic dsDNA virus sp.]|nr:MAG: hypothetical protein Unbinned1502contig1001_16 [Prokaryotic dsDNA virus sp.]|tara:strand:- start:12555 stop:13172 length:618 start_codon:yes stop_codon:yes gene_type:complete
MALATYSDLKTSIADFLNRDDLTAVIPDFIKLAEAQFKREIRHYKMMQRSEGEVDTRHSEFPADFLESIRFHHNDDKSTAIDLVSLSDMLRYRNENSTTGKPRYYAISGDTFEVYPTPDTTYSTELLYYQDIPSLSDSTTTNWLLTAHPDVYLYGALTQSAPYLKDDARVQVWGVVYSNAITSINNESHRIRNAGTGLKLKIRSY